MSARVSRRWVPATPPLNPQLGCLPDTEIADLSHSSSGDDDDRIGCPEGSVLATPPLNPQLGCISGTVAVEPEA
jgi:hypothetical protein